MSVVSGEDSCPGKINTYLWPEPSRDPIDTSVDLSNNNNSSDNLSILYSIDPKKSNPVVVNIHPRNSHDPANVGHSRDGDLDDIDVPKAKKDSFYFRSSFNDLGLVTKSNTTA